MDREISGQDFGDSWKAILGNRQRIRSRTQELIETNEEARTCTYDQGGISQELFHCKTCKAGPSAVCTACYVNCHLDHDVIELGSKSGFKCDCGTSRVTSECTLRGARAASQENGYNHNFQGKFCLCDSEETEEDDMTQCVGCLDWFHSRCLTTANNSHNFAPVELHQTAVPGVPADSSNYFLVCAECLKQVMFLPTAYRNFIYFEETLLGKRLRPESNLCIVERSEQLAGYPYHVFVEEDWIKQRCLCEECQNLYRNPIIARALEEQKPTFLDQLDIEANKILEAEEVAPDESDVQDLFSQISHLPHMVQIEVANGVQIFRDSLNDFMKRLSETSQVCGREQVEEFRRELQTKYDSYKRTKYE